MTLEPGMTAPDFTAPADSNDTVTLSDFQGQTVVLYFYPRDNTPGCTKQACGFRDVLPDFEKLNTAVIGVSKDSPAKHDKFKNKYDLTFPLVSDEDGSICESYGTWVEKSLYGKKYMGIERSTFLIDADGIIRHIWRGVKVKNHVEEVYKALRDMK
ncbi:MAG: thioredoxin-dependent thiol peroxidase [Pseudomonadota bacterium]